MLNTRIDRLITLYIIDPAKRTIVSKQNHLPILMYHSISEPENDSIHPYYQLSTAPEIFDDQMKFLKDNNYNVVNLKDAKMSDDKKKYVVLTFDDGFKDFYINAFPILQKYGFTATVFLATNYVEKSFKEKPCLTWDQIIELHKNNIEIGSHTISHPKLKLLTKDKIEYEVKKSKEIIENKIGDSIYSFSYPYAFPEENTELKNFLRYAIEKCGYKYCFTTIVGTSNILEEYFLKRIPINSGDDIDFFAAKLKGAYNWIHLLQKFSKFYKKHKKSTTELHLLTNNKNYLS